MPRVKRGSKRRQKRKKLFATTKGFFLGRSKLYRFAKEAAIKAGNYAYEGRHQKVTPRNGPLRLTSWIAAFGSNS